MTEKQVVIFCAVLLVIAVAMCWGIAVMVGSGGPMWVGN